jgi:hypothetical protein
MPRVKKPIAIDVEEIFLEPEKVVALLEAGTILCLEDDNGRIFARVEPIQKEQKMKPKKKPRKTT